MPALSSLRSHIHATWEAFFLPTIYLLVFIAAYYEICSAASVDSDLSRMNAALQRIKEGEAYVFAKEVELHKTIPFIVIIIIASIIYLFDRFGGQRLVKICLRS